MKLRPLFSIVSVLCGMLMVPMVKTLLLICFIVVLCVLLFSC